MVHSVYLFIKIYMSSYFVQVEQNKIANLIRLHYMIDVNLT